MQSTFQEETVHSKEKGTSSVVRSVGSSISSSVQSTRLVDETQRSLKVRLATSAGQYYSFYSESAHISPSDWRYAFAVCASMVIGLNEIDRNDWHAIICANWDTSNTGWPGQLAHRVRNMVNSYYCFQQLSRYDVVSPKAFALSHLWFQRKWSSGCPSHPHLFVRPPSFITNSNCDFIFMPLDQVHRTLRWSCPWSLCRVDIFYWPSDSITVRDCSL